jgi:hypothetical protein
LPAGNAKNSSTTTQNELEFENMSKEEMLLFLEAKKRKSQTITKSLKPSILSKRKKPNRLILKTTAESSESSSNSSSDEGNFIRRAKENIKASQKSALKSSKQLIHKSKASSSFESSENPSKTSISNTSYLTQHTVGSELLNLLPKPKNSRKKQDITRFHAVQQKHRNKNRGEIYETNADMVPDGDAEVAADVEGNGNRGEINAYGNY